MSMWTPSRKPSALRLEVTSPGGAVREWSPLPTRPDNHWFDCLVGCAAAASMVGIKPAGEAAPVRQRKRYTQEDLRRKDTWQNL